jgi:hypothetical protein
MCKRSQILHTKNTHIYKYANIQGVAEISDMLAEFQRQRAVQNVRMRECYEMYEAELREIGDTTEFERQFVEGPVDHSLMRHLNISKPTSLNYDIKEMEEADYADAFAEINAKIDERAKNKLFMVQDTSKPVLSEFDKENLREKLFSFLEECNEDERKLEREYSRLKEAGDRRFVEVGENLLKLQKRNVEKMKEHLQEYQPTPFGKAWGGDPEYAELSKRLKSLLLAEQGNIFGTKVHTKKEIHKKADL